MSIQKITQKIVERSKVSRKIYLNRVHEALAQPKVEALSCSNIAHTVASCPHNEKNAFSDGNVKNIAIVSAYNDMLSAHAPYYRYPEKIKNILSKNSMIAQVAGGVPAMCDGVTQGQDGMDLSLFSRDVIAQATAISLSHNVFDGAVMLGICDKIVPGLFMGLMSFGHLPAIFLPAGPMVSGISNDEKARIRQEYAKGSIGTNELLKAEMSSYSAQGTCTFYGTANTNQMLLEVMGLHVPGSSFVPALSKQRDEMDKKGLESLVKNVNEIKPIGLMIDEKSFVNAIVMLLATGGSTNHTLHLIAMARSCGIIINWQDFDELSKLTPLLAKIYPNGSADINDFHRAGGTRFVITELIRHNLLHVDVQTVMGKGLNAYTCKDESLNIAILQNKENAFSSQGGLTLMEGNLGKAVIKTSSLKTKERKFTLKAKVFSSQEHVKESYKKGELNRDFIAVLPFQGASATGMPELHSLSPILGLLQDQGHNVVLITDGRMSGASGKFPAIIHTSPEAQKGGLLGIVKENDVIEVDIDNGKMSLHVNEDEILKRTKQIKKKPIIGSGRELFGFFRENVNSSEHGASQFSLPGEEKC